MMILLILFLAGILRLVNLNQSLWLDEAVQAVVAKNSLAFAFEELKGDFHPPLFHLLMHFWVRTFGSSEVILRLPSVFFGVGTVWIIYLIGKKWQGENFGLLAALITGIAPFHIYYSQEARMYSMVTFFSSLSIIFFIKLLASYQSRQLNDKKRPVLDSFFYVFASILALYSDYYALLVIAAEVIAATIILRKKILRLLTCHLLIASSFLPVLPLLLSQLQTGITATSALPTWGKLVNLSFFKALLLTFIKFSLGRIMIFDKKLYVLVALIILGLFGAIWSCGARRIKEDKNGRNNYLIIFLWLVVPVLSAWLASLIIPNYQPFRLLLVLPAFYLLLSYGIWSFSDNKGKLLAMGAVLLVNLIMLSLYFINPYFWREDWRGVAKFIKKENSPLVISAQAFEWPLIYYGVEKQTIYGASGASIVTELEKENFFKKINGLKVVYTPYLADIYDPNRLIPKWLAESDFVKIKEISFNQIPLWIYKK